MQALGQAHFEPLLNDSGPVGQITAHRSDALQRRILMLLSATQDAVRWPDDDDRAAAPLLLDAIRALLPPARFSSLWSRDANALAAARSASFGLSLLSPPTSWNGPRLSKPGQENVPTTR